MITPSYSVTCTRKRLLAEDIYELAFTKPQGFSFTPGQFVLFDIPLIEHPADVQTRAMSIASTPDEPELLIVLKLKPGGRISRWVLERAEMGAEVVMKGPFGFFLLDRLTEKDYLFVATSTGIAPFRSQIISALEAGDRRRMDLVYGVRSEADLFWDRELRELAQRYPNFFLHLALSSPSQSWKGHRGRVQTLVPLIAKDLSQRSVYVCGNPDMTADVKKLALEAWGVPKKDLHVEGYI